MGRKKILANHMPPAPLKAAEPPPDVAFWQVNRDRKTELLRLLTGGCTKVRAAQLIGVSRDTIQEWAKHPAFQAQYADYMREHVEAVRVRRIRQTTLFADKTAVLVNKALEDLQKRPSDLDAQLRAASMSEQFRKWRAEERIDFGDNVSRKEVSFAGSFDVNQRSSSEISFSAFLGQKLAMVDASKIRTVDVDSLQPTGDAGKVMADVLVQLLTNDPGVIDVLSEEDRAEAGAK